MKRFVIAVLTMMSVALALIVTAGPTVAASGPCGITSTVQTQYKHIVIVMEENKKYPTIKNNVQAPYINSLMNQCASDTKYSDAGSQFPSFPNYIALTSGDTQGFLKDKCAVMPCATNVDNVFRQVRAAGGTAISYAESIPSNCYSKNKGLYAVRHVPAIAYVGGSDHTACLNDVVPFTKFDPNNLPTLSFVTPNLNNDMHNGSITQADTWLQQNVGPVFNSPEYLDGSTLVLILWDENTPAPNVFVAPSINGPLEYAVAGVGHYSVLAVVEDSLGLPRLGQATTANTSWRSLMGF